MTRPTGRRAFRLALLCGTTAVVAPVWTPSWAQTVIEDERTTPLVTSAAGDVTVGTDGSIALGSGTAITVDSDADVSVAGAISIEGEAEGARGVAVTQDATGSYTQAGTITISSAEEAARDLAPPDFPGGRIGFLVADGVTLTGDVSFSETSLVEVESAGGAAVSVAGGLAGDLALDGQVVVSGEDSAAVMISGAVTGDVSFDGAAVEGQRADRTITALGEGASGLVIEGTVDGAVEIGRAVTATAFTSYLSGDAPTTDVQDQTALRGGDAVRITGDVGGGLRIVAPSAAVAADPDNGVDAAPAIAGGQLVARGDGAALALGGGAVIGTVGDEGYGLINGGAITGDGRVPLQGNLGQRQSASRGTDAVAVLIEEATIAGGVRNDGVIQAQSNDVDVGATALRLGPDAQVPRLLNTGTISVTLASDTEDAIAVVDSSGRLTSLVNNGSITASLRDFDDADAGTTDDEGEATGEALAIDLSANTSGVVIRNESAAGSTAGIAGIVRTGSGDDLFASRDAVMAGLVDLGDGDDEVELSGGRTVGGLRLGDGSDALRLASAARLDGTVDFGGGAGEVFSLEDGSSFEGALTGAGGVALSIGAGSEASIGGLTATEIASLDVAAAGEGEGATLLFDISDDGGTIGSLAVAGDARVGAGTTIGTRFDTAFATSVIDAEVIRAGGALDVELDALSIETQNLGSFLFSQRLDLSEDGQAIEIELRRKSADELDIDESIAPAYEPLIQRLAAVGGDDQEIGAAVFNIGTFDDVQGRPLAAQELFLDTFKQFLGGPLDAPLTYARVQNNSVTSLVTQRVERLREGGDRSRTAWLQEESFFVRRGAETGVSNGFDGGGFVIALGADTPLGPIDTVGVAGSIASARYDEEEGEDFPFDRLVYSGSFYAADRLGPLEIDGRVAYGTVKSESSRNVKVIQNTLGDSVIRRTEGEWDGTQLSAYGRVRYMGEVGDWTVTPFASVDYLELEEDAYEEFGDLSVALSVEDREAKSLRANGGLSIGRVYDLRPSRFDTSIPGTLKPRLTAAWSQELDTDDLSATYRFGVGDEAGDPFTLTAEKEDGAAILGADVVYENEYATLLGGVSAMVGDQTEAYTLRVGVGLKW